MLTGHGGEESEVLCLEAGADDFVTKPINQAVLRARIETQLRLRSMREQLQQQNDELEAWRTNLERDLEAARLTQQSLIPQKPPQLEGWEVAAAYRPVIQVGGDIYGWLRMADGRTLFWIADATGHGASAALLTTLAKLLFHHGSVEHTQPAAIMRAVNNDFRSIFGARSFMTAMCVALDPETGRASVVGAGHPPLLVTRAKRRDRIDRLLRAAAWLAGTLGVCRNRRRARERATHFFSTPTDCTAPTQRSDRRLTPGTAARNACSLTRTSAQALLAANRATRMRRQRRQAVARRCRGGRGQARRIAARNFFHRRKISIALLLGERLISLYAENHCEKDTYQT